MACRLLPQALTVGVLLDVGRAEVSDKQHPPTAAAAVATTRTTTITATVTCFEEDTHWEPLDVPGLLVSRQANESACQQHCRDTEGCSHFSFWLPDGSCHLQDAFAIKRGHRKGFISGPFDCWSNLSPGKFAKIQDDAFVPEQFRCMQLGIVWEPTLDTPPLYISGDKEEVVLKCQQQCKSTWGCEHFSVLFPNMCRLAGASSAPLPAASVAISGPAVSRCHEEGYVGSTFMKKVAASPTPPERGGEEEGGFWLPRVPAVLVAGDLRINTRMLCVVTMFACGIVLALARRDLQHRAQRRRGREYQRGLLPGGSPQTTFEEDAEAQDFIDIAMGIEHTE